MWSFVVTWLPSFSFISSPLKPLGQMNPDRNHIWRAIYIISSFRPDWTKHAAINDSCCWLDDTLNTFFWNCLLKVNNIFGASVDGPLSGLLISFQSWTLLVSDWHIHKNWNCLSKCQKTDTASTFWGSRYWYASRYVYEPTLGIR